MANLTETERRVVAAVDDIDLLADLTELVAIGSIDGSPAEADAQRWCAERLADLGLSVDLWEIDLADAAQQPDFPGMEVTRNVALGCVATLGDTDQAPALAFCGHTDVVPPGDHALWATGNPFDLRVDGSGLALGRGACDMKAGVAAVIAAVAAVCRSGVALPRPISVHCVSAEEDGGVGAYSTLRRGHLADACLIAEPTSGDVIPANAGSLTFRLEIAGLATHGSTRTRGVSAVEKFELVHQALRDLETRRNVRAPELFAHLDLPWPLSVGIVAAGDWASTVPDRLVAEGRYGVRIDETMAEAVVAFEDAVSQACESDPWLREHRVVVTWPGGRFAPAWLPNGHPFLDEVEQAVGDVREQLPRAVGGPYGSDLRHYAAAGIPTVQYGPGDVRFAHAIDEHVELADVYACARVYAVLALRCGGIPAR